MPERPIRMGHLGRPLPRSFLVAHLLHQNSEEMSYTTITRVPVKGFLPNLRNFSTDHSISTRTLTSLSEEASFSNLESLHMAIYNGMYHESLLGIEATGSSSTPPVR